MALPVADGWAGAKMRVFKLSQLDHPYERTDGRTDKTSYRVASPLPEKAQSKKERIALLSNSMKVRTVIIMPKSCMRLAKLGGVATQLMEIVDSYLVN